MAQAYTRNMTEDDARRYLSMWADIGFSASKMSSVYGECSEGSWRKRIQRAKLLCPDSGIVPTDVPNGLRFNKTTVQYDANGNVIQEWRRLQKDQVDPELIAERVVTLCSGKLPKIPHIKVKKNNDLCLIIPIYDLHIGKYAWAAESGEDYDLSIVEKIIVNTIRIAVQRSGPVKRIILVGGGDWYHADNKTMQTERGGNVLDVDTRIEKVRDESIKAIHKGVALCSQYCERLDLVWIPGNHDFESAYWTARILEAAYSKSPHIHVDRSARTRRYIQHGTFLLGLDHGEMKLNKYISLMAAEVPQMWADTTERLWLLGHIHQQKVMQEHGVTVEHLESVSAADGWHFQKGYVGNPRRTVTFTIEGSYGLIRRDYITVKECLECSGPS